MGTPLASVAEHASQQGTAAVGGGASHSGVTVLHTRLGTISASGDFGSGEWWLARGARTLAFVTESLGALHALIAWTLHPGR